MQLLVSGGDLGVLKIIVAKNRRTDFFIFYGGRGGTTLLLLGTREAPGRLPREDAKRSLSTETP